MQKVAQITIEKIDKIGETAKFQPTQNTIFAMIFK